MAETAEVEVPIEAPSRPIDRIDSSAADLMNTMTSLHDQIATLRMQNSEYQARLLDLMVANESLQKQVIALNQRIEDSTKPPLFIASVLEVRDHEALIRQHGNNQELLVEYDKKLEVGMRVAVNNDLQIIRVLSGTIDERALIMEVIDDPDAEYEKIGGLDSQIQEVRETVELPLTSPELFETVGVEPPRGVLLYGPPGTGKTLLAEGARLVRDVFQLAREKAPTILFVDEVDAVGARRTHDGTVGSAEVNRTMTQILTELDGFGERGNVRVMAATNRIDLLDPALLRPGRFDRVIEIPAPNEAGRLRILSIHTKNMSLADDVDLATITNETDAATGADLKILVTEAGMNAIRNKHQDISMDDFRYALDKLAKEEKNEPHGMFV